MKHAVVSIVLGVMITNVSSAIEIPEIRFEPLTTGERPANRIITMNTQPVSGTTAAAAFNLTRVTVSAAGRQINLNPAASDTVIPMLMEDTGMIAMQWHQQETRLSAAELLTIQPALKTTANQRFEHFVSAKYLRRSPAFGNQPIQAFLAKTAYPVAIRPLADPTLLPPGSDFPVRLYMRGRPVSGAVLTATHSSGSHTHTSRSDDLGFAVVKLYQSGEWRLSFSQISGHTGSPGAVYTAVLEFSNRAGGQL